MQSFPEHWEAVSLKDVVSYRKGKKPKVLSNTKTGGTVPYVNIKAFSTGEIRRYADIESSNLTSKENVLVVWDGARSGLVGIGQEGAIGSTIMSLRPIEIDSVYLFRFLQTQYETINSNPRGTGIPHVDPGLFWNIKIPIAPLNEQRRIVAKLEKLLQKVDACKERLDKIPTILKRFRQSILTSACTGRLTADWREKHPDVEPATELLKQIQEERKEKRLRNPQVLQIDMDELPDTWVKTKISDVYDINPGHKGIEIDENLEVSFIPMKLIEEETGFMDASSVKGYKEVKHGYTKFIEDDVVFAKITPCMENGKIAIAKNLCNGIGCGTTELHVFRPVEKDTNNLLFYFLLQKEIREMAKNRFQGTSGHLRVPVDFFEEIGFPLPPLEEQQEIVRRIEALFKIADQIEERYKKARTYVDKLTQSILAKAFRGELVPQDPNDEPVAVLIKRIREERVRREAGMNDNKKNQRHNKHKQKKES